MGMPKTVQKLHKETNQDLIDDEVEAIDGYDKAIGESDNPEAIATYEHIKGEEEEHIEELRDLDKMKADEITSEQAWEDFKSGYADFKEKHIDKGRDGDKASIDEKIDVLSAKISELNTDMSRLTDSVPQALGTIEEGKTLEEEVEDEQEQNTLEEGLTEGGDEEGGLFDDGEDDGLGDFFTDEESEDGDSTESADDEGTSADESEEEVAESEQGDEEIDEGEEVVEDDATDDSTADEDTSDEDYIPVDDVMDEESDEDEKEEKVIDKMVSILEKMDRRITLLERENAGLKKQLSDRLKVQTEPRNLAKSRPTPNTNYRLVKGSYNRPPVSTQYVANQRDIGIGKKTAESSDTSVFRQGLNEVFENCERIANQNHF